MTREGEQFTPENVTTKRPWTGISPMHSDEVMGQVAKQDFSQDEMIEIQLPQRTEFGICRPVEILDAMLKTLKLLRQPRPHEK